jgi:hypothetical protein
LANGCLETEFDSCLHLSEQSTTNHAFRVPESGSSSYVVHEVVYPSEIPADRPIHGFGLPFGDIERDHHEDWSDGPGQL